MEDFELLSEDLIENLFADDPSGNINSSAEKNTEEEDKPQEDKTTTTEVNADELFAEPESVGSEDEEIEDNKDEEDTVSKETSSSPNNFYSSIASALKEDGVFPNLEDTDKINSPEAFVDMVNAQVESKLDDITKRVNKALNDGVEPDTIKFYENTLRNLDNIDTDMLSEDNERSETLRRQLIYQDLLNKNYTKEEAEEEVNDIFADGSDIKKANKALLSVQRFYQKRYQTLLNEAELNTINERKARLERAETFKKTILNKNTAFGDLEISATDRQKAYDAIVKPIWQDPETGEQFTAILKYEKENKDAFMMNLGIIYAVTDGFKKLDKLVNSKVKKESKKAIKELENTLNNTRRTSDGNLKFASGVSDDPESVFKSYTLDI